MAANSEVLAQQALDLHCPGVRPPVPIEAVLRSLGFEILRDRKMLEDGLLEINDTQRIIRVRAGVNEARVRFTLAHELAHFMLSSAPNLRRNRGGSPFPTPYTDEERVCDEIAAALLIPSRWLREKFSRRPKNLSTVRHLVHQSKTSFATAVIRLHDVLSWDQSLLRWEKGRDERWRLIESTAVPFSARGRIRTSPASEAVMNDVRSTRDVKVDLPLLVDSVAITIPAQLSVLGDHAMALACRACLDPSSG